MDDMFKTKTLREDNCLPFETRDLSLISESPAVPQPKPRTKPKMKPKGENKQRAYKLPAKEDGPGTEAAFAKWENPIDLNDFIEEVPAEECAFDALMGHRRRNVGEGRPKKKRNSSGGGSSSRRRTTPDRTDSFSDLARELLISDALGGRTPGPPPPFRGV